MKAKSFAQQVVFIHLWFGGWILIPAAWFYSSGWAILAGFLGFGASVMVALIIASYEEHVVEPYRKLKEEDKKDQAKHEAYIKAEYEKLMRDEERKARG